MAVSEDVKARMQAIHARLEAGSTAGNGGEVGGRLRAAHSRIVASPEVLRANAVARRVVLALRNLGYSDRQIVAGLEGEDLPELEDEPLTAAEDGEFNITDEEVVEATTRTLQALGDSVVDDDTTVDNLATGGEDDISDDELNDLSEVLEGYVGAAKSPLARTKLMARLTASLNCLVLGSAQDLRNAK